MKILRYKGTADFDDWVERYDDNDCWSTICGECMSKYGFTKGSFEIDYDVAEGVCGCLGCSVTTEGDYGNDIIMSYIDFDMDRVEFAEV